MAWQLPNWLRNNRLYNMGILSDDSENRSGWRDAREEHQTWNHDDANLIGSQFVDGRHPLHKVFIDLDVEHYYVESGTSGHAHLYINVDLTPDELMELQQTLNKFGIVGPGWVFQLEGRKENTFRMPNNKKTLEDRLTEQTSDDKAPLSQYPKDGIPFDEPPF